ncbi:MAG TPA: ATP-binding cassette domain-containing protein [Flavisolibacter sp.]|jgi:ABC-type bacteriocin/lantibiotic exporter with double-glycine peptidase domain|nr:ATP-binding cassette domain-containing protein [Flavisolibacter sp.]
MADKPVSFLSSLFKLNKILLLDRREIAVTYVFALLAGLVQLSLPLGIQSIISYVMAGSISTSIIVLISLVVSGVFINGLLQVRQLQIIEKVKQKLFVRYSLEYSYRLPRLNIEKLDNVYLPETVNRYFDSISLQKGIDKLLVDLPAALIQVFLGLVLLAFYHPMFIVFGLVLILIVFTIIRLTSGRGLQTALHASSFKYSVAAWLQETARTIKTFKYTKGTSLHLKKTDSLVSAYLESRTSHFKILLTQFWSLVSFKVVITAAMLILGSYLLVTQQINVGQFIASDIVIIAIIGSIEKLITNLDAVYDGLVSVEKLSVITDAEMEQGGSFELESRKEGVTIDFQDVSFAYTSHLPVLDHISFHIPSGSFVQIKGRSGSGKSTLLRLLTGAYVNVSGTILVDQLPITNYNIESLRLHTGILLGNQDIFMGTLWENLTLGNPDASLSEVTTLCQQIGLDSFIQSSKNGFDTVLLPTGNKLSGTVRKNILLVRALLGKHRLLLLEEPFEHLEHPYQSAILQHIKQSISATILIASSSDTVSPYCDQVIDLEQGTSFKTNN